MINKTEIKQKLSSTILKFVQVQSKIILSDYYIVSIQKGLIMYDIPNFSRYYLGTDYKVYNNMENTKYLNMEILRNNEIVELNYEID